MVPEEAIERLPSSCPASLGSVWVVFTASHCFDLGGTRRRRDEETYGSRIEGYTSRYGNNFVPSSR